MITILELAEERLGRKCSNGADFEEAGLTIMGGCAGCHASIAAYNAFPSKGGFWCCEDCIGDEGWNNAAVAVKDIFHDD